MRSGVKLVVLLAALVVGATIVAVAAATPERLYSALLTTKFTPMPAGYYNANVGTDTLDARDKKHHAVGRVLVTLDSNAGIDYGIYRSWQDARDRFKEPPKTESGEKITVMGAVPGFKQQSTWINGSITGKNAVRQDRH
jgi:hypothetical protein